MLQNVLESEHHGWGPKVFGGNYADQRDEQRARADLLRYEAELARLSELRQFEPPLADDAAYVGRLVDWTRRRVDILDTQRAEARRQALADAHESEVRVRHGLPPKPPSLTLEQLRDERHRAELAAIAA